MDEDGARAFLKVLRGKRAAAIDYLIGAASKSPDPNIRAAWGSLNQLNEIITDMEAERGTSD
jgi:hypothetical protein